MQQKGVEQNDAEPDDGQKNSDVDANQIGGPEQNAGAEAQESLPLAGQEEGDREQVGEHQERDVGLEILAVDRNHDQSLERTRAKAERPIAEAGRKRSGRSQLKWHKSRPASGADGYRKS